MPPSIHQRPDGYFISTDPARLDLAVIHHFLAHDSYWARNMPLDLLERAIQHSLNFGLYAPDGRQAGFARVVTDRATFTWLCDVFVLPEFRGKGLSKWLMECVWVHPDLQGQRRHLLATMDAHTLYTQFGFSPLAEPERFMEIRFANPYGVPTSH